MTATNSATAKPTFRQQLTRDLKDFFIMSAYLAVLFCAISAYTQLHLIKYGVSTEITFTVAIIKALVVAKVILTGERIRLGRHIESRSLYLFVLIKSIFYTLLVFVFHILEEVVMRIYHHEPTGTVVQKFDLAEMTARSIIVFCAFVPLFAFREVSRVLGPGKLQALFRQPAVQPPTEPARSITSPLPPEPTSPAPVQPTYP